MSPGKLFVLLTSLIVSALSTPVPGVAQRLSGELTPIVAILPPSQIFVAGKSNVNQFNCDCEQDFSAMQPRCYWQADPPTLVFENTQLRLRAENLDCGNRMMNRDLRNTLRADQHPEIRLDLRRLQFAAGDIANAIGTDWTDLTAHTNLTLAGQTRRASIRFRGRSVGHEVYELVGVHEVRMTDFGVEPPTAMMGLVKVDDHMRIHFKLWLSVRSPENAAAVE
jgi:hypothetical protein